MDADGLSFTRDGAQRFRGAVADCLDALRSALAGLPSGHAGVRFHGLDPINAFLAAEGQIGSVAATMLGAESRPVRAILFDKTAESNWSLGWHQDRTICVKQRVETDGFGPWTMKAGMQHVAPPFDILARMATLRVHLDDVSDDNSPLLVAPGSHAEGRVAVGDVDAVVRRRGVRACLADAGDIWLYATPILHASGVATTPSRRRVLQVDYARDRLPGRLEWQGV